LFGAVLPECILIHACYLTHKHFLPAIESAEEENEFLPVQEMCGKHEQQMVDV
jgi:hypothetical protein